MIFNSYEFIFGFLPVVWVVYMALSYGGASKWSRYWLVVSSLFFYSFWNIAYFPLIMISMVTNYALGTTLGRMQDRKKAKSLLTAGVVLNALALGYYKYFDFFINNTNALFQTDFPLQHIVLPLGISFFTFQQIAYLVDAYRHETKEYDFWNYSLFVTFFPQLIAGPIVHHQEVMPQFAKEKHRMIPENIAKGMVIFSIGLFKKVVIADTFAAWASAGYAGVEQLSTLEAWIVSLSYTLQLYFDFSGYSDMAIGAALFFNIVLPINFNSPYKAVNIQDFWKRWHMTLTRFLTHYLYIPLGGNRKGIFRTYLNVFLIFLVSGIWHGAGWTFIFWGAMHGIASMVNRLWQQLGLRMYAWLGWLLTMLFVNVAWVFFRAPSWEQATWLLSTMIGQKGTELPAELFSIKEEIYLASMTNTSLGLMSIGILAVFIIVLVGKNSVQLMNSFVPTWKWAVFVTFLLLISIFSMAKVSEFLYFNF